MPRDDEPTQRAPEGRGDSRPDDPQIRRGPRRWRREFLYVDDAARALPLAAERLDTSAPVNFGTGIETRIRELAELIHALTGYDGETVWDASRPDGQPQRVLDVSRAHELMGFQADIALADGLRETIASFERNVRV